MTTDDTKTCTKCCMTKPVSAFYKNSRGRLGVKSVCKSCDAATNKIWREANRDQTRRNLQSWRRENKDRSKEYDHRSGLRKHGCSVDQYEQLLHTQGGVCAICGGTNKNGRRLSIDHDHRCCDGKFSCGSCIRGLVCEHCNYGLGHFRNSVDLLTKAARYIGSAD